MTTIDPDLLEEVKIIQQAVSKLDDLSFKIKGWCITLLSGLIIYCLQLNIEGIIIIFVSIFIPLLFWLLDATFKLYQRAFLVRLKDIQEFINKKAYYSKSENISKFYRLDLNFRLSRKRDAQSLKKYLKDATFYKCLFVRNIWIVYYWIIVIGIFFGVIQYGNLITRIIIYFSFAITLFIFFYVLLGGFEFHETRKAMERQLEPQNENRIKNKRLIVIYLNSQKAPLLLTNFKKLNKFLKTFRIFREITFVIRKYTTIIK